MKIFLQPCLIGHGSLARLSNAFGVGFFLMVLLNLLCTALCNASENQSQFYAQSNESALTIDNDGHCEITASSVWSQALEDYVLSQSSSSRASKDLQLPYMSSMAQQLPLSYHSSVYPKMQQQPMHQQTQQQHRPGAFMLTKRIGEEMELEAHMRPPIKVVNPQFRPMTNQMLHHPQQQHLQQQQQQVQQQQQPSFLQQLFGIGGNTVVAPTSPPQPPPRPPMPQQQQQTQHHHQHPTQTAVVSENDLYMLGAIEKLVYRVDYLESRIRRAEQLLYHYFAGSNKKEVRDPCPTNFTRISDNCYLINSKQQVNWKTANTACKGLSAHLAEFEQIAENEEIMAHLLNQAQHRGRDYWLGGLNPGLIWIWSNSAKPVNPNMNLTSIAMTHSGGGEVANLTSNDSENSVDDKDTRTTSNNVSSNTMDIKGEGRCLKLAYQQNKYVYYGQECTNRHHYICEYEDKTLDNKIKKMTRDLKLFH